MFTPGALIGVTIQNSALGQPAHAFGALAPRSTHGTAGAPTPNLRQALMYTLAITSVRPRLPESNLKALCS